jgi:penicillin-binding protein 1A
LGENDSPNLIQLFISINRFFYDTAMSKPVKSKASKRPLTAPVRKGGGRRGFGGGSGSGSGSGSGGGMVSRFKKRHPLWAFMIKMGVIAACWGTVFLSAVIIYFALTMPEIDQIKKLERRPAITFLAADGAIIARYGGLKGQAVEVKDLPDHVIAAFIAAEDRRFYKHFGIDPIGFARAMVINISERKFVQGGSTITQQLAKNLFLTPDKKISRKAQEALLALWLEAEYSKDEILTAYLNRVYFGAGAYGIDAAAKTYFNKSARDLSLYQAAVLAGLLPAPSRFAPSANPKAAAARADLVLDVMLEIGLITEKQRKNPKTKGDVALDKILNPDQNRYFTDWAMTTIEEYIKDIDKDVMVKTTLNPKMQAEASRALNDILEKEGTKLKTTQGAVVTTYRDGAVLTLVGGRDYDDSEYNRAATALRQPGSSFKPFVYLGALERGFAPYSLVMDAPITEGRYRPQNYDGDYRGEVSLTAALALSLNTATIRLAEAEGIDAVIDTAKRAGIKRTLRPELSLALGSQEMTVLEMAGAYTAIMNGGYAVEPYGVLEIKDVDGKVLYERKEIVLARSLEPSAVEDLQNMMSYVVSDGTGQAAQLGFTRVMGKTGTSQDYRDAWFIGFTSNLTTAVWMGNDDNSSTKRVSGGKLPARLFREYMAHIEGNPVLFKQTAQFSGENFAVVETGGVAYDDMAVDQRTGFGAMLGRLFGSADDRMAGETPRQIRGEVPQGRAEEGAPQNIVGQNIDEPMAPENSEAGVMDGAIIDGATTEPMTPEGMILDGMERGGAATAEGGVVKNPPSTGNRSIDEFLQKRGIEPSDEPPVYNY